MNYETLINGYKHILDTIYSPRQYYERVRTFLKEYKPPKRKGRLRVQSYHIKAFIKSLWFLGVKERGRRYYWRLLLSTLLRHPRSFPLSVSLSVFGFHFRKISERFYSIPIENIPTSGR
jgi:hypothetical protein